MAAQPEPQPLTTSTSVVAPAGLGKVESVTFVVVGASGDSFANTPLCLFA